MVVLRKEHFLVDIPNTMSISKTFNISDIYKFHPEDEVEDVTSRMSSYKVRGMMSDELAEEYMENLDRDKRNKINKT
ncbi:hypothetical protein Tco_1567493 [Tanacetum coccineum]